MYRAIDIYLKAHPAISDMDRKKRKAQLQEIEKATANTPKGNAKGTTSGKPPLPIAAAGKPPLPIAGGEAEINLEIEGIRYLDMNFLMHELNSHLFFFLVILTASTSSKSSSTKSYVFEGGGVLANVTLSDSSIFMDVGKRDTIPMACNFDVEGYSQLLESHYVIFVDQHTFLVAVS
uniref:Uncharacterized protein n=1 Tax=Tanacetum cinerariifolium TaxID=118510 RepID=A0A6L2MNV0_TANCI|nr:hypothetical protein [Tanacetum cinerariifolium]